jgi:hypothetical protein
MQGNRLPLSRTLTITVIVLALLVPVAASAAISRYGDVPDSNVFAHDIEWLADTGVTRGCNPPANDMFCPDSAVTRGQMAAFLHRFADLVVLDDEVSSVSHEMIRDGAVNSTKTWDEPGVAVNVTAQQMLLTQPAWGKLDSISITPPAPGFVFAEMSATICIDHTNGTEDLLSFGFSETEANWSNPGPNLVVIPDAYPTSRPCEPVSQRVVYEVPGGAPFNTHLYGQQPGGVSPTSTMFVDTILTLTYYPTAYGMVDLTQ